MYFILFTHFFAFLILFSKEKCSFQGRLSYLFKLPIQLSEPCYYHTQEPKTNTKATDVGDKYR